MKALLYKDLVSGKSTYLLALVIVLVIAVYLTFNEAMVIIPFLFAFMPMVLNTISFAIVYSFYKFIKPIQFLNGLFLCFIRFWKSVMLNLFQHLILQVIKI